jgi:hypothetical protein
MRNHRSTVSTLPKIHPLDNFNPADALESLHGDLVQLEALAHVAAEVIARLAPPAGRDKRRDYRRAYALVTKVAEDAVAAVRHGDALVAALSDDMTARRTQRADPPAAKA